MKNIGKISFDSLNNVAIGLESLSRSAGSADNIAIGYNTMSTIADGVNNVAIGSRLFLT